MNKSLNRSIIDADWHPSLTGIIAISYAFSTMFSISGCMYLNFTYKITLFNYIFS